MTTLFIRPPAKADSENGQVQFALVADGGGVAQQGAGALTGLRDLVAACRRVVLLLAASDVTLLTVKVPPLPAAKLRAALPGLVEDQILSDPADCVLVAAPPLAADGTRTIAVAQRAWLEAIVRALLEMGARSVGATPLQLCLPLVPGGASALVESHELTLRTGVYEGLGIAMADVPVMALQTARTLAGEAPLTVFAPAPLVEELSAMAVNFSVPVTVQAESWEHLIAGARSTAFDIVPALGAAGARQRDWQRWKWPVRIAIAVVVVNLFGLNVEWLRMKREADAIRQSMTQTFKSVYPNQAILDPVAQMKRNVDTARTNSGQVSPSEFAYLAASLGEAVRGLGRKPQLAAMEYREGALLVKAQPGSYDPAAVAQMNGMLSGRGLALVDNAGTWEVRSAGGRK